MARTFSALRKFFLPSWMLDDEADGAFARTLAGMLDEHVARTRSGMEQRFPSRAGAEALALTGADRLIVRGRDETAAHYAARLAAWRYPRGHRVRGNVFALLEQIAEYYGGGPFVAWGVDRAGNRRYRDGFGAESFERGDPWVWDSLDASQWSRQWIVISNEGVAAVLASVGYAAGVATVTGVSDYDEGGTAPTVALTSPVASTAHLVGAVLRISGVCSADTTAIDVLAAVDAGAMVSIGAATVSGTTWLIDYAIVAGDIGTLTLRADATGPGGTTESATVAVTVTSMAALVAAHDGWAADWRSDTMTLLAGSTVTDPGFDDDAYWTKDGGWAIADSAAAHPAGSAGQVYKTTTVTVGRRYGAVIVLTACSGGHVQQYHNTQGMKLGGAGTWATDMTAGGTRTGLYAVSTTVASCSGVTWSGLTCSTTTPGTRGAGFSTLTVASATDVTRPFKATWGGRIGLRFDADIAAVSTAAATHNHLHDGSGATWWWAGRTYQLPASTEPLFATCVDANGCGVQVLRNTDDTITAIVAKGDGTYALDETSTAVLPKGRCFVLVGRWSSATNYEVWLDGVKIIDAAVTGEVATDASAVVTYGALPGVATYPAKHIVHEFGTLCERATDAQLAAIGRRCASDVGQYWPMPALLTPPTVAISGAAKLADTATYDGFGVLYQKTDGSYYYLYREGTTHAADDGVVKARTSADGSTWGAASTVFATAGRDLRNLAGGEDSDGRWWVYLASYNIAGALMQMQRSYSDDEGATWSALADVADGISPHGPLVEWSGNRGVMTRWASMTAGTDALVTYDAVDARTVRLVRDEAFPQNTGTEYAMVALGEGKLLWIGRDGPDDTQMTRGYSEDGGLTWDVRRLSLPQYDPSPATISAWSHVSPWAETHADGTVTFWIFRRYTLSGGAYYGDLCTITCDPRVMIETPQDVGALLVSQWSDSTRNAGYPSRAGDLVVWFSGATGATDVDLYAAEVSVT